MAEEKPHKSLDKSSSITEAFIKHESFLKRYLSRFLSRTQDIEDVVQETYLKSYMAEKKREIHSPKAFLFRVARNAALKELTKKSRQIVNYIEDNNTPEPMSDEDSVEDLTLAKQKLGLFCQSALEMTPRCRRVFLMAKVYGFSYKEISAQMDISVSAVEKQVAKGLEICSNYMARMEQLAPKEGAAPGDGTEKTARSANTAVVELFRKKVRGKNDP
ncbi:RNA polymerase sigma factor [Exilibacterium tricleocarpae]|uniref:RNA polymerase sigma factor n=1 Tax=Exilibacterium tricleocarpae TaxID=2591008 RepID=A0A545SPS2_9GAMM|nr:RNA polymerase sigma factor [Exilibacterium tricleocarpae]TQV66980.1 RNA polymerase sigma factor [Exilibacterium tricleocarpae]